MKANPSNGYVVYPSSTGYMSLAQAKAAAKRDSKEYREKTRVENVDTEKVVARYENGREVASNGVLA